MYGKRVTVTISYEDGKTNTFSGIEEEFCINRDLFLGAERNSEGDASGWARVIPSDLTHYRLHVIEANPDNEEGRNLRLSGAKNGAKVHV